MKAFTPLGVAFNRFEKDPHPASDDSAYRRFPGYLSETVPIVAKALDAVALPVARCDQPEVLMSERRAGAGRYLFVVNNTTPELEPGHIWRTTLLVASRVPLDATVKLTGPTPAVYDVFAGRRVEPRDGAVTADLRALPARLYAVLPTSIRAERLG